MPHKPPATSNQGPSEQRDPRPNAQAGDHKRYTPARGRPIEGQGLARSRPGQSPSHHRAHSPSQSSFYGFGTPANDDDRHFLYMEQAQKKGEPIKEIPTECFDSLSIDLKRSRQASPPLNEILGWPSQSPDLNLKLW